MNNINKAFKVFKRIPIIFVLLLTSIYLVIKYSDLPVIAWLPSGIIKILMKPEYGTTEYEIYRILENLSLAYIASYIFYILIDYLPKRKNEKFALISIQSYLINLYLNMSTVIAALNVLVGLKKEINQITKEDLIEMDEYDFKAEKVYYHRYNYVNGELINKDDIYFNYLSDTPNYIKKIKRDTEKIKNIPCSAYINYNILLAITDIEINDFLNQILNFEKKSIVDNVKIIRGNLGLNYYKFIKSYLKLGAFVNTKYTYVYDYMNEQEKEDYLKKREMWLKSNNLSEEKMDKHKIFWCGKEM
jgi:hypothetical protein